MDDVAPAVGGDGRLAGSATDAGRPRRGPGGAGRSLVADVRAGHGERREVVVRQHADLGAGRRCATSSAVEVDLDGTPGYVLPDDLEPEPHAEPWCALLPGLDVTTMGWQDRDWYLGEHRSQVFDRNGNGGPDGVV